MVTLARNKLFTPVHIGAITLKHRVVMPPLSRLRAEWPSGVPSNLMLEYYSQRASDGGLIFTEAIAVSRRCGDTGALRGFIATSRSQAGSA